MTQPPDCFVFAPKCFLSRFQKLYLKLSIHFIFFRFAGTWNASAVNVLSQMTKKLIAITKRSLADLTGRAVIEQTMCVLVLAQAMVMAGSGDLGVMRTCRMLRARVHNNNTVTYGSHMAVHMALGLLFLGGGNMGLACSPEAIAAMICAFYPKFPTHSSDNRYHLQALRHLYVLAVEPRVLVPRSSETGEIVTCHVEIQYRDTSQYRGVRLELVAPVLLPSLSLLSSVSLCDPGYWTTEFRNIETDGCPILMRLLANGGDMSVKKKSGAGLGQSLPWSLANDQLIRLSSSSGPMVSTFLSLYLTKCPDTWTTTVQCLLSASLALACPTMLTVWSHLLSPTTCLEKDQCIQVASNIKTLVSLARSSSTSCNFLQSEMAVSLLQKTNKLMDVLAVKYEVNSCFGHHLGTSQNVLLSPAHRQVVSSVLLLHSLSSPQDAKDLNKDLNSKHNPLRLAKVLKKSSSPASLYRLL